jgi:glycine hydroxymethyltransferase
MCIQDFRALLNHTDRDLFAALTGEENRQRDGIELIPSENYTYPEVLVLLGSVFTNKYSEGYPGRRYYGGQEFTDTIESLAIERAMNLFRAGHANVQPLSGSVMNQAVYFGLLEPGDKVLAMDLSHGGHLTHGAPASCMGKIFNFKRYRTDPQDGSIDFDQVRKQARRHKPKLILCGYSSYPRDLDYQAFRSIADEVGALTMADISHFGGLVAGKVMNNPFDAGFDVVTSTSHKSLRGPRGGMILCKKKFAKAIDHAIFPGLQGGPHMNKVAAITFTLKQAATSEFADYSRQVLRNAKALAQALLDQGVKLVTGGTDNHLMVVDTMASFGLTGEDAQVLLDSIGITVNKQIIPDDPLPPLEASGIRLGTPAATTRGMDEAAMRRIADWIVRTLTNPGNIELHRRFKEESVEFCRGFHVPGIQDYKN